MSARGLLSWLLVIATVIKVGSTILGLWMRHSSAYAELPPLVWWSSKVSAVAVAAVACLLATLAGDALNQAVFGALLIMAIGLVVLMTNRRRG